MQSSFSFRLYSSCFFHFYAKLGSTDNNRKVSNDLYYTNLFILFYINIFKKNCPIIEEKKIGAKILKFRF